jgi:O-antigen/teichoic acid export membrane protein
LNAAYGITLQLQQTVLSFVNNFQMALNPQIIKKYASGEKVSSIKLMLQSSKFSFYLMFLLVFPILMNTKYVLELWLKNLPTYTVEFVQLSLIAVLIDTLSNPLMTGLQATGEIKRYQMIVGGLLFMNLPISYVLLTLYNSAQLIYVAMIVISFVALFFRLYFLHKTMKFSFFGYLNEVILRIIGIVGINVFISLFCIKNFVFSNNLLTNFLLESLFCLIIIVSSVSVLGFNKGEKNLVLTFLSNRFFKIGK